MELFIYCAVLFAPFFLFRIKDVFQPELVVNAYFVIFIALGPLAMMAVTPQMFYSGQYEFVTGVMLLGYCFLNVGFFASAQFFKGGDLIAQARKRARFYDSRGYKFISLSLLMISLLSLAVFFLRAGQIPILAADKEVARVEALSVGGNGYLLYLATLGMTSVLLYATVEYWNAARRSTKPTWFLFLMALVAGTALMGTGSRRYFFWTCLYVLIARHYLFKKIPVALIVTFGVLGFVGVNVFEMYRNVGSDTTVDFMTTSYYRLIVYFYNLEATFVAFQKNDLMWGSTFYMDVLTVLPGKQIDYQSWIKEVTGLEFEGFGVPPTIVGDMYINFGMLGIVVGCFVFGYLLRSFYYVKTHPSARTPISILLYALVLEISIRTLTSGVSAQAMGLLWVAFVYLGIVSVHRMIFSRQ